MRRGKRGGGGGMSVGGRIARKGLGGEDKEKKRG